MFIPICDEAGLVINQIEWTDMEIPETITYQDVVYTFDKFRGIYTTKPYKTKQDYLADIDDDVPF